MVASAPPRPRPAAAARVSMVAIDEPSAFDSTHRDDDEWPRRAGGRTLTQRAGGVIRCVFHFVRAVVLLPVTPVATSTAIFLLMTLMDP